jgi:hypothetical protein
MSSWYDFTRCFLCSVFSCSDLTRKRSIVVRLYACAGNLEARILEFRLSSDGLQRALFCVPDPTGTIGTETAFFSREGWKFR